MVTCPAGGVCARCGLGVEPVDFNARERAAVPLGSGMSRCDAARTEEDKPVLKWLVLPIAVCAYLAVTVSAATPRDRDHDRLPDRWERNHHLSSARPSAKRDPDRDRLNNLRELRLRTHPRRSDTDRDRLRDGAEVRRFRTNPRRWDTDGDGFRDRCELRKGTNPRTRRSRPKHPCSTSPQTPPTDPAPPPPPPASGPEPGPIAGQGYTLKFQDQLDRLGSTNWGASIWYDPGAPVNSIFVQNGILNLVSRRSQGYQNITVSTEGGTAPRTFKYGYFEARMKWTKGNGAWPAFWLYSYRHATNPAWPNINPVCSQLGEPLSHCWAGELDVFEGQGNDPSGYYGTIHQNSCGRCNYGGADVQNSNNYTNVAPTNLTTGFHTYGMLWTATEVKWYLDGQLLQTATPYESLNQPMFLLFDMYIGGWSGGTDASTPDELKTEVAWVKVWQK
jgi:Glycosyl hydrolases family 16/Bacterial TSP3 repeat